MNPGIEVLSSMATRQILAELVGSYEQRTRRHIFFHAVGGVDAAQRVRNGEPADVVVLASKVMEQLEVEGHIFSGSRRNFASSVVAMAVASGAARPSAHDEEAVKQAILEARRIGYSTGPSGDHITQLCERWGLAGLVSHRAVQAPPGVSVGELIARGEVDLGFQQLSELLNVPGIDIIGPLPTEIQSVTVFSVGLSSIDRNFDEARALVDFLTSPETDAAKRRHGMEPA